MLHLLSMFCCVDVVGKSTREQRCNIHTVFGIMLFQVGVRVGQENLAVGPDVGKGIENMGEL